MDGRNAAVPADALSRPRGVFVAYAHEPEGRRIAVALVRALRMRGCDVVFDDDVPPRNPVSVPTWMDDEIAVRVVLCVLTPGYLRGDDVVVAEGMPKRKGVRYELRAIRQRIYDHEGRYDCPVIPVAVPGFPAEQAPATLRGLEISRFDPADGAGADRLVERIATLEGRGGSAAMNAPTDGTQRFRQVVRELEEEDLPAERAIALVRECLRLAHEADLSGALVPAFPQLANVIKDHGQISLMRTLTEQCVEALRARTPLWRCEHAAQARLLVCGSAWYLQRDHQLQSALDHAQEGIRLAERYEARRTAAYGRQCLGRIQRLLAEDAQDRDVVDHYLAQSSRTISEAVALFHAIDGDRPRRSEAGACLSLGARTQLIRYRRLDEQSALAAADELAREADRMLTVWQKKDRHDLAILRAEIAAAYRRHSEGRRLLSGVIESLIAERGELSEILARAYVARANLAGKNGRSDVIADLRKARDIFRRQQLGHAVAVCDWMLLTIDSRLVTPVKVSRGDIVELEALSGDPRVRLAAIARVAGESGVHTVRRRRIDWAALVERG